VVTNAGGNPEVIQNNYNGFVTPNRALQAFSDRMLELAKDTELRSRFGKNSYQRFLDVFTNKAMSNSYSNIYHKISEK
jgi:glycosyltransferase involved in cell wall biosynthesis